MEIIAFGPDDQQHVASLVAVENAVRRADSPWDHLLTVRQADGELRHGWDGEPAVPYLLLVDGEPVAAGRYATSDYDNRHLAWLDLAVHPDHRRRGHGSALYDALVARARAEGRTSVGAAGWEGAAAVGFAGAHGLEQKAVEVNRRQLLADVDPAVLDALEERAAARAASYELVRQVGPVAEADLAAVARMVAAINDAPTDDLDVEDEVFSPERIRAYEAAQAGCGHRLHRLMARHRTTGELAGETVVAVDGERPELAEQHNTAVVAAHRGHALGTLLKVGMLRWLAEEEPQVVSIDTWNAESNRFMIDVNEALGYRVVGRALAFQRSG